jgi:quinol monooxygenase YgiN
MSNHVFVVSEWLAKEDHEQELRERLKNILDLSLKNEKGCLNARVTRQIQHPGSPTKSKYTIVLLQEYTNVQAFDTCSADYVTSFFKTYIENKDTAIVEDWQCRLFSEE